MDALRALAAQDVAEPRFFPSATYLGPPTGLSWCSPSVAAQHAESIAILRLAREGLPLPAHIYSELLPTQFSPWWPASIQRLHTEAETEAGVYRRDFQTVYPTHPALSPDRAHQTAIFIRDTAFLHAVLACCHAIFWRRTRIQEGVTAAQAARGGFIAAVATAAAAAAARATTEYTRSLMTDGFLSASLQRPRSEICLWGTDEDPRNPVIAPDISAWTAAGWGTGWASAGAAPVHAASLPWVTGGWGNSGGWGNGGWGTPPVARRRRRWYPRHYGHRRMGAIFRPPRTVRVRRRTWVQRLELKWRRRQMFLLKYTNVPSN
ncbi:hypothetical protein C8R47DRAFT_1075840 [Mycena vitilis]|nr:hypothetical protein C8R47DRAFT_1075840 [Mycena vitilis]